jgi:glycosyltransferase involved in cell wall biosynthesis
MEREVTIGLCVKNAEKVIKTAFKSISVQDYPHRLIKLVIVDNDSCDNTYSLAAEFAQKTDIPTVLTCSTGGLGEARQKVVELAEGDYLIWVDDDLVLCENYVRCQVEFMEKNPKAGAARGLYNEFSGSHKPKGRLNIVNLTFIIPSEEPLTHIGTGGSIFRLPVLKSVGGFDVRIKGAGEDVDVSHRINRLGWILLTNFDAKINAKYSPLTLKSLWKKNLWYGYGNHFLWHKYGNQRLLLHYFPPVAIFGSFKIAFKLFRCTSMKKVFFYPFFRFFEVNAQTIGYLQAHVDGYGH